MLYCIISVAVPIFNLVLIIFINVNTDICCLLVSMFLVQVVIAAGNTYICMGIVSYKEIPSYNHYFCYIWDGRSDLKSPLPNFSPLWNMLKCWKGAYLGFMIRLEIAEPNLKLIWKLVSLFQRLIRTGLMVMEFGGQRKGGWSFGQCSRLWTMS